MALEPVLCLITGQNNQREARPWYGCHRGLKGAAVGGCQPTRIPAAVSLEGKSEWCNSMATHLYKLYKFHTTKPGSVTFSGFMTELRKEGINLIAPGLTLRMPSNNS